MAAKKTERELVSKFDMTVSKLIRMMDNNEIDYDASIQRGNVWDESKSSKFIQSILLDYPTGVFYMNRTEDGIYECLEGKQRSYAIYNFVKKGLRLHKNTGSVKDDNGDNVEIKGRTFKELAPPKQENTEQGRDNGLQARIMEYPLLVYCFENMSVDGKIDFFTRINSGKPVTLADISRIKVKSRKVFTEFGKHPVLNAFLSEKSIKKYLGEDIARSIFSMCYNDNKSLLEKDTSPYFETTEVTKEQEVELHKIFGYMYKFSLKVKAPEPAEQPKPAKKGRKKGAKTSGDIPKGEKVKAEVSPEEKENSKIRNKMMGKTNLISLGYMAWYAIENNTEIDKYIEKALEFFTTKDKMPSISEEFNRSITGGAKPDKVLARINAMEKHLKE